MPCMTSRNVQKTSFSSFANVVIKNQFAPEEASLFIRGSSGSRDSEVRKRFPQIAHDLRQEKKVVYKRMTRKKFENGGVERREGVMIRKPVC